MSTLPGSLAGVFPPLIAWAATGSAWSARVGFLCLFVFVWSPSHFWALALARQEDYVRAGIPTPVQRYGERTTKLLVLVSVVIMAALSLLPWMLGFTGEVYPAVVAAAGVALLALSARLVGLPGTRGAWALHKLSGPYLAVLLAALALPGPDW